MEYIKYINLHVSIIYECTCVYYFNSISNGDKQENKENLPDVQFTTVVKMIDSVTDEMMQFKEKVSKPMYSV